MAISEAVSRSISEAASPTPSDAVSTSGGAAAPSSGGKTAALWVATLLTLGSVGALGYTQWWIPREHAQQQMAQVKYEHCLEEVKVYLGKPSYTGRLTQCVNFLND